jgi:hypothetical protein
MAALPALAQQTGGLEFSTRITPTAGRAEPARLHPFYLLRKSHADIQKEAEETEPKPDLEKFVDGLDVSKELKAWMKRTKTVQFTAGDFNKRALVDDVFDVPEFFEAYITQNAGDPLVPSPKYGERDREKNPQRYEKQQQEYRAQLRKFARQNPHTMTGIEVHLSPVDPGQRWTRLDYDRRNRVRFRALELAQTKYLVARIETDIEGRAAVTNVLPGDYWLSTLGEEAVAGDARLRWDAPVKVVAGRVTRVELSNVNAASTSPSK